MVYNNSANINPTGLVLADGSGGFSGVTTTQYNVQVGATANGLTSVAPSATSGVPLISQGNAANPTFGTAVVAGGGTGSTSFTAYSVVCAGTSSTGNFQNVSGLGSSGQVLTSNGAGLLPTWQAATGGAFTFTDQNTNFTAAASNGYFVTATAIATLPSSPSQGDRVIFVVDTANVLTITANTGQKIRVGSAISATAGTCASNAIGSSLELVYRTTGATWFAVSSPQGTWTLT